MRLFVGILYRRYSAVIPPSVLTFLAYKSEECGFRWATRPLSTGYGRGLNPVVVRHVSADS